MSRLATLLLLLAALVASEKVHDKIVVAVDYFPGRYPFMWEQKASSRLLKFKILNTTDAITSDVDIAVGAHWASMFKIFDHTANPFYQTIFGNTASLIDTFEDKMKWKEWMASIGLGNYIPRPVPYEGADTSHIQFPVFLKTAGADGHAMHSGNGIHIVRDPAQLHGHAAQIAAKGLTFFLEEPLSGMGLAEMSTFGSVFRGQLLSARCFQRVFSPEKIAKSSHNTDYQKGSSLRDRDGAYSGLYIKGPSLRNDDDYPLPCGTEVVSAVANMFAHTNYTGLYCANWKLDSHMRPKMMEINARFCGTLRNGPGDPLLLSAIVTLGYAALEANRHNDAYTARSALLHGPHKETFERIRNEEYRAVATGGGYTDGLWNGAAQFDMTKRLSPLLHTYKLD
jgi:hypothetical protein